MSASRNFIFFAGAGGKASSLWEKFRVTRSGFAFFERGQEAGMCRFFRGWDILTGNKDDVSPSGAEFTGKPKAEPGEKRGPTPTEYRLARAAEKLRENLARRKVQTRARRKGEAEDGVGLPASGVTKSDVPPDEEV